jgi:signal transduction histidine kinase
MTIRTRLTLWYALVLAFSLLLISGGTFQALYEQLRHQHRPRSERHALGEASELVFEVGLPAVVLGLAGGWWLTRRALAPLAALTRAAEHLDEATLNRPLPRSGNGDELDRLTEVLNATNARLHHSFSRIREFTLHASHELKTPLTVLCGETEMALRDESLAPAERERCASQLDELRRLTRIVDGLTLLAKADAGQVALAFEPLRFDELVRDSFADTQILAQASGIRVELAACEAATVRGDAHRLRQLLLNLADNAVKYNQPQGAITMTFRRADQVAEFIVTNTGPGIPAATLPRVFDRFYRGDPAHSSDVEGCGLGLSIAQWIVTAHSGNIGIESVPSGLTTVTVRLPVLEETNAA